MLSVYRYITLGLKNAAYSVNLMGFLHVWIDLILKYTVIYSVGMLWLVMVCIAVSAVSILSTFRC